MFPWDDKRKTANEFGAKAICKIASAIHILRQILAKGTYRLVEPSSTSSSFTLPIETLTMRHSARTPVAAIDLFNGRVGEKHRILDSFSSVDEPQRVIAHTQCRKGTELLLCRFVVGTSSANPLRRIGGSDGCGAVMLLRLVVVTVITEVIPPRAPQRLSSVTLFGSTTWTKSSKMRFVTFS